LLNPCFVKVARLLMDQGKGSCWTVDNNVDPRTGMHRVQKKKTKKGKAAVHELELEPAPSPPAFHDPVEFAAVQVQAFDAPRPELASLLDDGGEPRDAAYSTPAYPTACVHHRVLCVSAPLLTRRAAASTRRSRCSAT
jgi:forkhead box protein J2/3